ncbi:hypothetical protein ACFQY5_20190 [Paeniroseomonas aquatica]|uniref:hypothetical protein n=1 Tax=Paeniroseomonas aquatica TaxID=373043 RepID=UPI00361E4E55
MGERAIRREAATAEDIAEMHRLVEEGMRAGAFGFTTSRTNSHKTLTGEMVPGRYSEVAELMGIGQALGKVGYGAFGMNSDFDIETEELGWMTRLGQQTGRPVWFLLTDWPTDPARWKRLMEGCGPPAPRAPWSPPRSAAARLACCSAPIPRSTPSPSAPATRRC